MDDGSQEEQMRERKGTDGRVGWRADESWEELDRET